MSELKSIEIRGSGTFIDVSAFLCAPMAEDGEEEEEEEEVREEALNAQNR
jgi:hypothetical protein